MVLERGKGVEYKLSIDKRSSSSMGSTWEFIKIRSTLGKYFVVLMKFASFMIFLN